MNYEDEFYNIIDNHPRSEWYDLIYGLGNISVDLEHRCTWIIQEDGKEELVMNALPEELKEGYQFPINRGDILESKEDGKLWIVANIPVADSRSMTTPGALIWAGNTTELLDVTNGDIIKDTPGNREAYIEGYCEDYIVDDNFDSKYTRIDNNDPRISDTVKHYQDLFMNENYGQFNEETNYVCPH